MPTCPEWKLPAFVEFPVAPLRILLGHVIDRGVESGIWPLLKKKETVLMARAKVRDKIILSNVFKGLSWSLSLHLKVITA